MIRIQKVRRFSLFRVLSMLTFHTLSEARWAIEEEPVIGLVASVNPLGKWFVAVEKHLSETGWENIPSTHAYVPLQVR
jgi:hypothetical protein